MEERPDTCTTMEEKREQWIDYALKNRDKQLFNILMSDGWRLFLHDRYKHAAVMVLIIDHKTRLKEKGVFSLENNC